MLTVVPQILTPNNIFQVKAWTAIIALFKQLHCNWKCRPSLFSIVQRSDEQSWPADFRPLHHYKRCAYCFCVQARFVFCNPSGLLSHSIHSVCKVSAVSLQREAQCVLNKPSSLRCRTAEFQADNNRQFYQIKFLCLIPIAYFIYQACRQLKPF